MSKPLMGNEIPHSKGGSSCYTSYKVSSHSSSYEQLYKEKSRKSKRKYKGVEKQRLMSITHPRLLPPNIYTPRMRYTIIVDPFDHGTWPWNPFPSVPSMTPIDWRVDQGHVTWTWSPFPSVPSLITWHLFIEGWTKDMSLPFGGWEHPIGSFIYHSYLGR